MSEKFLCVEIYGACMIILFMLIYKVLRSNFPKSQQLLFKNVALSNIAYLAADLASIIVNGNSTPVSVAINWVSNSLYFVFIVTAAYLWFQYSETMQNSSLARSKRRMALLAVPMVIVGILSLTSYWTHTMFYIDAQGVYMRGPLHFLQPIVTMAYLAVTGLKAFYLYRSTENAHDRSTYATLASFIVPTLIAALIQTVNKNMPTLCAGVTISLLLQYISFQEQLISRDPLTGLNNRNRLEQFADAKLQDSTAPRNLYLLLFDVDKFKEINDTKGHLEGDRALQLVAQCLASACVGQHDFIARYGGDEFVMFHEGNGVNDLQKTESLKKLLDRIDENLNGLDAPYSLSVSVGYARFGKDGTTLNELIHAADERMYLTKKAKKNR